MINNDLKPIQFLEQKKFDETVGNPEKFALDLKINKAALERLKTFENVCEFGTIVFTYCISYSLLFAPLTLATIVFTIKFFFDRQAEAKKTEPLTKKLDNSFNEALKFPKELFLPFFQKHGHLARMLSHHFLPTVSVDPFLNYLRQKDWANLVKDMLYSIQFPRTRPRDLQDKFITSYDAQALKFRMENLNKKTSVAASLILKQQVDVDELTEHGFSKDMNDREIHKVLDKSKDLEEDELCKVLYKKMDDSKSIFITISDMASIIKACPNLICDPLTNFRIPVRVAIKAINQGVEKWQDNFFESL